MRRSGAVNLHEIATVLLLGGFFGKLFGKSATKIAGKGAGKAAGKIGAKSLIKIGAAGTAGAVGVGGIVWMNGVVENLLPEGLKEYSSILTILIVAGIAIAVIMLILRVIGGLKGRR